MADFSETLFDITGGILGKAPGKAPLTEREKLIKRKRRETSAEQTAQQEAIAAKQPQTGRYQLTGSEALIPGVDMGGKYQRRTPEEITAAQNRSGKIGSNILRGAVDQLTAITPTASSAAFNMGKDLWEGGKGNRQVVAPAMAAFTPEVPTEQIGKASIQDVASTIIKNKTDVNLNRDKGLPDDTPAGAEITYGSGDGVNTDKVGKPTPNSAEEDAAQNDSASAETSKHLENSAVKADDDVKVKGGVLGDATKSWWFNVTDSLGDALMNYGIAYAASGGDKGKAFASAGQTLQGGFDKYDRRQQIGDLRTKGYSDAEIMNYINSGQLSKPLAAGAQGGKALTEAQQKAKAGASRAEFINKNWGDKYSQMSSEGDYPLATRSGQVREMFDEDGFARKIFDVADPEYSKAFKDEMGYLAGVLRPESGSAIGKMEWENYGHIYFPRYGDKPQDIARKNLLREMTIKTLQSAGDPSDREAQAMADELTQYADRVVKYVPEKGAYLLDNGKFLAM